MHTSLNFCAIDFETACAYRASACSVALVRVRNGEIVKELSSFIRPPVGMEIQPFYTSIHGIKMEDVATAPTFAQLWPRMEAFIGTDYLVAHNSGFDRSVLTHCLKLYDISYTLPSFSCTVQAARTAWPWLPNHKLNTVAKHLAIKLDHHQALSDTLACAKIFIAANSLT